LARSVIVGRTIALVAVSSVRLPNSAARRANRKSEDKQGADDLTGMT
jgi:hypothetical protein